MFHIPFECTTLTTTQKFGVNFKIKCDPLVILGPCEQAFGYRYIVISHSCPLLLVLKAEIL